VHAAHFGGRRFAHEFRGGRGFRGAYGWYGPVFWPYAYDDIFDDILWGFGLGGPFWAYGYNDLYGGLFSPYGYNDLAGYLPGGEATAGRRGQPRQAALPGQLGELCGDDSKEVAGWPIDRIQQAVTPTPEQQAALDDFANATIQASQTIKEACPTSVALAPTGRLDAMQQRIAGMTRGVEIVRPPLDRFYGLLTDEQKARLNAANEEQNTRKRASLVDCGAATNATRWPGDQIEKAVRPDPSQQAKLDALKTSMANASDALANACPAALPATPPARLAAMSRRLDAMLQSVKNVRAALDDFYNSLSDEQKAQFNMIGRQRTAGRQS
jgi:LTXXQ motif family protein